MKQECNGHSFSIGDESFYRCILDGKISFSDMGFSCSNCGRVKCENKATVVLVRINLDSIGNIDIRPNEFPPYESKL